MSLFSDRECPDCERLRAERDAWEATAQGHYKEAFALSDDDVVAIVEATVRSLTEAEDEIDSLTARLAEAERLLREARADVQFHSDEAECWDCVSEQGACIDRLARIDAFLASTTDNVGESHDY